MDSNADKLRGDAIRDAVNLAVKAWVAAPKRKEDAFTETLAETLTLEVGKLFTYVTKTEFDEEQYSGGDLSLGWPTTVPNPNGDSHLKGVQHCLLQIKSIFNNYRNYIDYLKSDPDAQAKAGTAEMKELWGFDSKDSKGFFNISYRSKTKKKTGPYQLSSMIKLVQTMSFHNQYDRISAGYLIVNKEGCTVLSIFDIVGAMERQGVSMSALNWQTLNSMLLYTKSLETILYGGDDQDSLKTFVIDIKLNDGVGDFKPTLAKAQ
jgi:hypothetical protein